MKFKNLYGSQTVSNNDKCDGDILGVVEDGEEEMSEVEDVALLYGSPTLICIF